MGDTDRSDSGLGGDPDPAEAPQQEAKHPKVDFGQGSREQQQGGPSLRKEPAGARH
jgi:hypothetical protein